MPVIDEIPKHPLTLWNIPSHADSADTVNLIGRLSAMSTLFCAAPTDLGAGLCLESGAHDAMTRPLDLREARVRVYRLLAQRRDIQVLKLGEISVSLCSGEVKRRGAGNDIKVIRAGELRILRYLTRASDRFVSTEELQHGALKANGDGAAVRFHVKELRRQLGEHIIETRRGLGYRLKLLDKVCPLG